MLFDNCLWEVGRVEILIHCKIHKNTKNTLYNIYVIVLTL